MKRYAVIGNPIFHSKSPLMHNAAFKKLKIEAEYEKILVKQENLGKQIKILRQNFSGWNVTVPYKQAIIPFLDEIDENAQIAESVNTVLNKNGLLYGFSTDGFGLQKAIENNFQIKIVDKTVLFIGAGGATQAGIVQFLMEGVKKIYIINRTFKNAEKMVSGIINRATKYKIKNIGNLEVLLEKNVTSEIKKSVDLIIQCTSAEIDGAHELAFNFQGFRKETFCFDMIYFKTKFLQKAQKAGLKIADGNEMLLYQGAKAFEIWTNHKAPLIVMSQALITT